MSLRPVILSPLRSKRDRIWPLRPRCTASGFSRMRVRSMDFLGERCSRRGAVRATGAGTIPVVPQGRAGFPAGGHRGARRCAAAFACAMALVLVGCAGPRENSMQHAARAREADRLALAAEDHAQQMQLYRLALQEDRAEVQRLRDEAAFAASRRRDLERALAQEQQELAALRARVDAAAGAREQLTAALAELDHRELKLRALRDQTQQADQQLAAATQQAAELNARLEAARARLQQLKTVDAEVQKEIGRASWRERGEEQVGEASWR